MLHEGKIQKRERFFLFLLDIPFINKKDGIYPCFRKK
jgi:hypothetical protein